MSYSLVSGRMPTKRTTPLSNEEKMARIEKKSTKLSDFSATYQRHLANRKLLTYASAWAHTTPRYDSEARLATASFVLAETTRIANEVNNLAQVRGVKRIRKSDVIKALHNLGLPVPVMSEHGKRVHLSKEDEEEQGESNESNKRQRKE